VIEIVEKNIIKEEKDISRDPTKRTHNEVAVNPRDPTNKSIDMTFKIKTQKISESLNEDIIQRSVSFLCQ
jgi:hypothetical protein